MFQAWTNLPKRSLRCTTELCLVTTVESLWDAVIYLLTFNTLHDITIKNTVGEGRKGMWRKRSFALGFCLLPHAWSLDTDPLCHNDSCLKPLDICSLRIVISSQGLTVFSLQEVSGKSNCEIKQDLIPGSNQRRVELFTKCDSQQKTGGSLEIKARLIMHPARRGLLQTLLWEVAMFSK